MKRLRVDLLAGTDLDLGTVVLEEPAVCGLHHAIGATPGDEEGRASIVVTGTWTRGVATGDIEVDSNVAWGAVVPLLVDGTDVHVIADGMPSTVTLHLSLTDAMAEVDPSSDDLAVDLLRALTTTATTTQDGSVHR